MGFKQSLICPICNYEKFTSGRPDRGFRIWTNTYVCLDCKTINDLIVEKGFGNKSDKVKEDQECDDCGGKNFEVWDSINRPCPKCGSKMNTDPNGDRMYWD